MSRFVVFSHGKESGPWGTKIVALAEVARALGWQAESIDYQGMDDAAARVAGRRPRRLCLGSRPVLVGSSMGGHVATAASVEPAGARALSHGARISRCRDMKH
jgi:pimeloyl-ACP methyl ester carboxylesterase